MLKHKTLFSVLFTAVLLSDCLSKAQPVKIQENTGEINILMTGFLMGSHLQNEWELARAMSLEPGFNVTFITSRDFKPDYVSQNGRLNIYRIQEIAQDDCLGMLVDMDMDFMSWWGIWMRHVAETILNNQKYMDYLRKQDFDMILYENLKTDEKLARVLNLTLVQMSFYFVSPDAMVRQRIPLQTSHTITLIPDVWALQNKIMNNLFTRMHNLYYHFQVVRLFNSVHNLIGHELTHQYLFGSGIHGISDPVQWTQASELVFPMSNLSSKFSQEFISTSLEPEYEQFLSTFEASILVTFGTTFQPTSENTLKLVRILESAELQKYGVIFGLKDTAQTNEAVQAIADLNLPNIMLRDYVPQKQLLNDPRVKLLITHCGANSVHEAFYFGTVVYGIPIDADQPGICSRIHDQQLGVCADISQPEQNHVAQIVNVLQKDSLYDKNVQQKKQLMEFEEQRSGVNVYSISRYSVKFGTKHLYHLASSDHASFIQTYDLDLLFTALALMYLLAGLLKSTISK